MHNVRISQIRIKSDYCQKKGRYVHSMHTYVNQRMWRVKLVAIDSPQYSVTFSDVNVLLMLCHLVVNFVELLFLTFTEEFSTIWPWPKMNTIAKDMYTYPKYYKWLGLILEVSILSRHILALIFWHHSTLDILMQEQYSPRMFQHKEFSALGDILTDGHFGTMHSCATVHNCAQLQNLFLNL